MDKYPNLPKFISISPSHNFNRPITLFIYFASNSPISNCLGLISCVTY
jgi:hypothetical protein